MFFFLKIANSVTVLHRLICTSGPKAPHGHHVEDHGGHGGHGHDHPKDIHAVSDVMWFERDSASLDDNV